MPGAKTPFADSAAPLYRQVRQGIERLIRANGRAGKPLLTDAHLAEKFGVSRITVRRAVDELVDAGVLYRMRGRGTFVRTRKVEEKVTLRSFLDAWTRKGERFDVRVAAFERRSADRVVAQRLGIDPGQEVLYVRRLRYQKSVLVAVDDRYMRPRYFRKLTRQDVITSSLVDYLREREKMDLSHGEMEIEARRANASDAAALGIRRGAPVLVRRMIFFSGKGEPVLAGISTYRADRVSYRLTISG